MSTVHRIALLGFSAFERSTLGSYFRLASTREPRYEQVQMLPEADFVVADADHEPAVKLVMAVERMPETVFVGARAPEGAIAWLTRPIDPMRVLRELDVMAARRMSQPGAAVRAEAPADAARRRTVIQPVRPARPEAPAELLAPSVETLDLTLPDLPGRAQAHDAATPRPALPTDSVPQAAAAPPGARAPVLPAGPAPTLSVPSRQAAPAGAAAQPPAPIASAAPAALVAQAAPAAAAAQPAQAVRPAEPARALHAAHDAQVVRVAAHGAPAPRGESSAQVVTSPAVWTVRAAASMPAAAARPAAPRPAGPALQRNSAATASTPSAALLVDDSEIALRFLQKKLAPFGLRTDCVSHSEAAMKLLAERRYDFVFLDMELGEHSALDGLGLCQRIKESPASANVVMVTAHHTELDRVRGALAGCDGFLGKPLDEEELSLYLARFGVKPAANAGRVPS